MLPSVVKYGQNRWLLPRPYLLQIKAKLADILSVLLYANLASYGSLDRNACDITSEFIFQMCRIHERRPLQFFTLAASIEGLVIGLILKKTEKWANHDLWELLVKEVNTALNIDFESEELFRIMDNVSISMLAELGCLSKITGHPLVDMLSGSKKLFRRAQETFPVSLDALSKCIN